MSTPEWLLPTETVLTPELHANASTTWEFPVHDSGWALYTCVSMDEYDGRMPLTTVRVTTSTVDTPDNDTAGTNNSTTTTTTMDVAAAAVVYRICDASLAPKPILTTCHTVTASPWVRYTLVESEGQLYAGACMTRTQVDAYCAADGRTPCTLPKVQAYNRDYSCRASQDLYPNITHVVELSLTSRHQELREQVMQEVESRVDDW